MKITKNDLRSLIREELKNLQEAGAAEDGLVGEAEDFGAALEANLGELKNLLEMLENNYLASREEITDGQLIKSVGSLISMVDGLLSKGDEIKRFIEDNITIPKSREGGDPWESPDPSSWER